MENKREEDERSENKRELGLRKRVERGKLVMKIYDVANQGPLTKISPAIWTIDIREKIVGLDALEDRAQGLLGNLPLFIWWGINIIL